MSPEPIVKTWEEIRPTSSNVALLAGNGMSCNVWPDFGYKSLFEEAVTRRYLSEKSQALFRAFDTENFERVLSLLRDSAEVVGALGDSAFRAHCESVHQEVRESLGRSVRAVHLPWDSITKHQLMLIKEHLATYTMVFSTNYDLLIYWAIMTDSQCSKFADYFWSRNSDGANVFDPRNVTLASGKTGILYLHGALHLESNDRREVIKRTASEANLLDQFGVQGQAGGVPLIVAEGKYLEKLDSIRRHHYLSFAYEQLRTHEGPIVVFGSSLGATDQHLRDALKRQCPRKLFVSVRDTDPAKLKQIEASLYPNCVEFFDAKSHPLGSPELVVSAQGTTP